MIITTWYSLFYSITQKLQVYAINYSTVVTYSAAFSFLSMPPLYATNSNMHLNPNASKQVKETQA